MVVSDLCFICLLLVWFQFPGNRDVSCPVTRTDSGCMGGEIDEGQLQCLWILSPSLDAVHLAVQVYL